MCLGWIVNAAVAQVPSEGRPPLPVLMYKALVPRASLGSCCSAVALHGGGRGLLWVVGRTACSCCSGWGKESDVLCVAVAAVVAIRAWWRSLGWVG